MTPSRLRRAVTVIILVSLASMASAATTEFRVFFDTDRDSTTGCTVGGMSGVEQVLSTVVADAPPSGSPTVTITRRQLCTGGALGAAIDVDASGWPAAFDSANRELTFETRIRLNAFGPNGVPQDLRLGFETTRGSATHTSLLDGDGSDIIIPAPPVRRRAAGSPGAPRTIVLDGLLGDWDEVDSTVYGIASDGTQALRVLRVFSWFDPSGNPAEKYLYFAVIARLSSDMPYADDDLYTRRKGQNLAVSGPGVLQNDGDPFGQPLEAVKVTDPERGSVSLNSDGSFTYSPDYPQVMTPDEFEYKVKALDNRESNVARVEIRVTDAEGNEPPSFTAGGDVTVDEDSGLYSAPWATAIGAGAGEADQTVTFTVTNDFNSLFSQQPAISPTGTLTFVPAGDGNGSALVTVKLTDSEGASTSEVTFLINVTPVNDAPTFVKGSNQAVPEDSPAQTVNPWATSISPGPSDEVGETVAFTVTGNTNPSLFSTAPAVSPTGVLTYTPAANRNGTATITLTATDNGTPPASSSQQFTITLTPVNDTPSFTAGGDVTVGEDSGAYSAPWATSISAGPFEPEQTVSFTVSNNNNSLFSAQPAIAPNGTLTFTPALNAIGSAVVSVTLFDNLGGSSAPAVTFTINVTLVNDPPSFVKGAGQTVNEDAGAQTVNPWATAISPGPPDESGQTVAFNVTGNTNPALFSAGPLVDPAGVLTYTPAADANGVATITITLTDNGAPPATSAPQSFTITVNAVNDEPSFTIVSDPPASNEDAGLQTVNGFASAISVGPPDESVQTRSFAVTPTTSTGDLSFLTAPAIDSSGNLTYTASANTNGTASFSVVLTDNGGNTPPNDNTSGPATFTITVNAVNDPPTFTLGGTQTVNEDAGPQTVAGFASSISVGPANESTQTITSFNVSNDNNALFFSQPAIAPNGTLTYRGNDNLNGTAIVTVTATDSGGATSTPAQTFTIVINAINDEPSFIIATDPPASNEDGGAQTVNGLATSISAGPPDESGQSLTFTLTPTGTTGGLTFSSAPAINAAGNLTYTATGDASGTASFSVVLTDGGPGAPPPNDNTSATATFTITVSNVNDPPTFTLGGTQTVNEDAGLQTVAGFASSISVGPPNESAQTITSFNVSNDNNGLFSGQPAIATDGTLTYTPAANEFGSATVTVTATDSGGATSSPAQTFTITVSPINDEPSFTIAGNPSASNEDAGLQTVNGFATAVSAGPVNESSQTLTFTLTPTGTTGGLTFSGAPAIDASGNLTYTATGDASGTASFSVVLTDSGLGAPPPNDNTSPAQAFTITVNALNDAPVVTAGNTLSYTENAPATNIAPALTVTDIDDVNLEGATVTVSNNFAAGQDVLSFAAIGSITFVSYTGGVLTLTGSDTVANYQAALRTVKYANTSDNPTVADRTITWSVSDGDVSSAPVTSTIQITAVNDAPVAVADSYPVLSLNTLNVAAPGVLGNDTDAENNTLNAVLISGPTEELTFTFNTDGSFSYKHDDSGPNSATDSFTYKVNDGSVDGNTVTVTINITYNQPPVGVNDSYTVTEGQSTLTPDSTLVANGVLANDTDAETNPMTAVLVTPPVHHVGTFTLNADGTFAYTHDGTQPSGPDSFTYRPSDLIAGQGNLTTVTITITAVNDSPVAVPDTYGVAEGGTLTVTTSNDVLGNDTDEELNPLTAILVTSPTNHVGVFTLGSDGTFTYNHDGSNVATDSFTYKANDSNSDSNTVTVTINVTLANDAPVANADGYNVNEGGTLSIATFATGVVNNDTDEETTNTALTATLLSGPAQHVGVFTLNTNGTFTYTHNGSETITDSFTYKVSDGSTDSNTATVTITVNPVNDAPSLSVTGSLNYTENGPAASLITSATISDPDDTNIESATIQITGNYQNGADVLSYAPALGITGVFNAAAVGGGMLTLTGSAPLADYQTALANVKYINTSESPSALQRTVTWTVNDGSANSNQPTSVVNVTAVNDPPVINAAAALGYTEDAGPVAIDGALTVSDLDDALLPTATVQITANYVNGQDILAFATNFGITGVFDAGAVGGGMLTLTGPASPADFQSALRTVTYQNTSNTPSTAPRTVTWTVNDDEPSSGTDTTTINVTATNDAPALSISGNLTYTENDAATSAITSATITDADDTNIESATIQITGNYQNGQDVLSFVNTPNITGVWTVATGLLTLSGSDTLAAYQTALQNVKYNNTSENPSTLQRTVTWRVNDGDTNSNAPTSTIDVLSVNDAPVVTPTGTPLAYTENDPATAVQSLITVSDADSTNLTGATIKLTTNYANGQDVLSYVTALGITGSWNAGTGTLTLSGTTTVANYQTALRNVLYNNTSENPSTLARTVVWQVNDGAGVNNLSTAQNSTINVTAVNDPPVADNDPFDFIGNTDLSVDSGALATPHALETTGTTFGVLDGDSDPAEGNNIAVSAITVGACTDNVAPFDCTDAGVGRVQMQANGRFIFTPAAGDTGASETFGYTVTDDGTPSPASTTATVTLTRFERVWYIQQGGTGTGTSVAPLGSFTGIAGAGGAGDSDFPGDYIFVHSGSTITSSIELESQQRLLGGGVALSIPVNLNGNGSPTNLVSAGATPTVTSSAAVGTISATAAMPVEIRGLNLVSTGGGGNAIDVTTAAALSGSSTLTISSNTIGGASAEGIDVNLDALTTGTLTLNVTSNTWNASGTHTGMAATIDRSAGTLHLNFSGNTNILSTGSGGVRIASTAIDGIVITGFAGNSIDGNTPGGGGLGGGVKLDTLTIDALPLTAGFQQVDGDNLLIGSSVNPCCDEGLVLGNVRGNLFFDDLDIFATSNGLRVTGSGDGLTLSVTPASPDGSGTSEIESGDAAVDVTTATIDLRLSDLQSITTSVSGVALTNVAGQFRAPAGSVITKTGGNGTGFSVNNSTAGTTVLTSTYAGTINNSSGSGRSILINNADSGSSVSFTGQVTDTGQGVSLTTNTGATISFTGALTLSTTTNTAFNATGGGTVTSTNTTSTLTTTTGTALNVANTTIGASNLTFRGISSNGAASGIVLNTTGSSGGLKVLGNTAGSCGGSITLNAPGIPHTVSAPSTADCSGGTIQASTGAGVSLTSTANTALTRMYILNSGTDGMVINTVTGFTLANSYITDGAGGAGDRGIEMGDFSTGTPVNGTISISNSTIGPTPHDNFGVGIASGTSTWSITNTVFTGSVLNSGFNHEIRNATMTSFLMDGCVLQNQFADGMQMQPASGTSGTITSATIQNSTFTGNNIGMDLNHDGTASVTYKVLNNTFRNHNAQPINFFTSASAGTGGTANGRFVNNFLGTAASASSGSAIGNGIRINVNGGADTTVLLDGNVIRQMPNGRGIEIISRNGTGGTDATLTNNTVDTDYVPTGVNGGFSLANIFLQSNCLSVCNTLRSHVNGNTVPAVAPTGELAAFQLVIIETGTPDSTNQLVDIAPASGTAAAELASHNTGSAGTSGTVTLIAGPINTPP